MPMSVRCRDYLKTKFDSNLNSIFSTIVLHYIIIILRFSSFNGSISIRTVVRWFLITITFAQRDGREIANDVCKSSDLHTVSCIISPKTRARIVIISLTGWRNAREQHTRFRRATALRNACANYWPNVKRRTPKSSVPRYTIIRRIELNIRGHVNLAVHAYVADIRSRRKRLVSVLFWL